ncbi:hypothetical protein H490_0104005 [Leucobacter sp. UCD-THU]|uniref:hypothetical protein n=1 Tax=Leucobacter sp. UCD-THU TaxID=1292023 RepID=UPI00037D90C3|nr:hypothetical protein [Leucobacter sp. UCD-THU]EYT56040.1 hypothetical protein H490_0104005 [Leucobacter sp. UCD-THU]
MTARTLTRKFTLDETENPMSCKHDDCCTCCQSCYPPEPPRSEAFLRSVFGPPIWEQAAKGDSK